MKTTLLSAVVLSLLGSVNLPAWAIDGSAAATGVAPKPPAPPATITGLTKLNDQPFFTAETFVDNVEIPWAMVFKPDGDMLFTERPGRVRLVKAGKLVAEPVYTVANIRTGGEIGLMGMCLHPDFDKNKLVYIAFGYNRPAGEKGADGSDEKDAPKIDIRVMRLRESEGKLVDDKLIIAGFPAQSNHAGCCVKFGPDGKLYISTGEMFKRELARDMTSLGGKILRLNDDGSVPADNPFVGRKDARPEIWSFGHRNPQGLAWQPGTNQLYSVEHGPSGEAGSGGDEFNIIYKGEDYGWPEIHNKMAKEGLRNPLVEWTPAIAPSGAIFYTGDAFPQLKGKFLFCALGGLRMKQEPGVYIIGVEGEKVTSQDRICAEFGRVRAITQGPDGSIYFSTSNKDGRARVNAGDDRIVRLAPKKG